jgi:hypothetical protein
MMRIYEERKQTANNDKINTLRLVASVIERYLIAGLVVRTSYVVAKSKKEKRRYLT